eukprot:SAG11_NODE_4191_length_2021_cov_10.628512_1_plen_129_part_00
MFGFQPRRPSDLIHANVKSLPEGMLRNNFETNQRLLDELRASMLDQHQAAAEEMAARMAVRYRDLPESWGMDDRTWYVYLNTDAFTDNRFDKAGVRNKHYKSSFRILPVSTVDRRRRSKIESMDVVYQ